jgi:hypothetical protein
MGQEPHSPRWLLSGTQAFYSSSHPESAPWGVGAAIAYERATGRNETRVRVSAGTIATFMTADDISLCHPLDGGGCLPDAVFPERLWILETAAVIQPARNSPIALLLGAGVAVPKGARENERHSESLDSTASPRPSWRAGFEITLGHSRRAPRVQAAYSGYIGRIFSMNGLTALSLILPL